MAKLEWTGERMVTEYHALGCIEHLHRYSIVLSHIKPEMTVLDAACGEGYGTNLIANKANKVFGVDISKTAIDHAKDKYKSKNIQFIESSATNIPLDDNLIDLVVSFETLEHMLEQDDLIKEFKRILKPNGIIIISSPDKEFYKEGSINPYHLKELFFNEFESLVSTYFKNIKFIFQKNVLGSYIYSKDLLQRNAEYKGDFNQIKKNNTIEAAEFCIAIASDSEISHVNFENSFFDAKSIYEKEKYEYINKINSFNKMVNTRRFYLFNKILKVFNMKLKF